MEQKTTISEKKFGLSPIQEKAATLLATGKSISETADAVGVNRGTLYAWQEKPNFKCYLNTAAAEIQEKIKNGIFALNEKALKTIEATMDSKNELMRLKAAFWILEKIQTSAIGETDAEKVIRESCTTTIDTLKKEYSETFDVRKFENQMRENGLMD